MKRREGSPCTHRDVNDSPDATLAIFLKHGPDLLRVGEIDVVRIDLGRILVLLGSVLWKSVTGDLSQAGQGFGIGVVIIVDADYFVPSRGLEGVYDVRACTDHKVNKVGPLDTIQNAPM